MLPRSEASIRLYHSQAAVTLLSSNLLPVVGRWVIPLHIYQFCWLLNTAGSKSQLIINLNEHQICLQQTCALVSVS